MKYLMFLVTFWSADAPPQVYVEDSGLTPEDCIELLLAYDGPGTPSCEIDHAADG